MVTVFAPASIGNFGLGFDILGAAVTPIQGDPLGDRITLGPPSQGEPFTLTVTGPLADCLPADPHENIVFRCYHAFAEALHQKNLPLKPLTMQLHKGLPVGSGLGSSACSVVAALVALNAYHGEPLGQGELLPMMGRLEGSVSGSVHYDNVVPCYLGGLRLLLDQTGGASRALPFFDQWLLLLAYPGVRIATARARAILPDHYSRAALIEHGRQLATFVHALHSRRPHLAAGVIRDVVAEPYRQSLIPGFEHTKRSLLQKGALACGISGSGSTIFAVVDDPDLARELDSDLQRNFFHNERAFSRICRLDQRGARLIGADS